MGNAEEPHSRPGVATLTPDLKDDIELWLSSDITKRNGSLARLISRGSSAATALVEVMFRNASNTGRQVQIQNALREIGAPSFQPVADALARVPAVRKLEDCALLEDLTETLLSLDARRAVAIARQQLDKLNAVPLRNRVLAEHINNARLHLVLKLAHAGCRESADEVIAYLGEGTMLVPLAIFDVLEKSGDSRALVPLLRLFPRQTAASEVSGRKLMEAFRAIVKREKLTEKSPCFAEAGPAERDLLEKWMAKK